MAHFTNLEEESYSLLQYCNNVEQDAFDLKSELRAVRDQSTAERKTVEAQDESRRRILYVFLER